MPAVLDAVTDAHFDVEVLESERPVLVDFWAPWCGPCRVLEPVLEELAAERPELRVVRVNIDENLAAPARYSVLAAPTLVLFRGGRPLVTLVGTRPKRRLTAELDAALAR